MDSGCWKRCNCSWILSRRRMFTVLLLCILIAIVTVDISSLMKIKHRLLKGRRDKQKKAEIILPKIGEESESIIGQTTSKRSILDAPNDNVARTRYVAPTYYTNAYLVSAKGGTPNIRLPSIRQCVNEVKTKIQIGSIVRTLSEGNRHSQCPVNNYPEMCGVKSALEWATVLEEDLPRPLPDHVNLIDVDGKAWPVPLIDSREGGPRKRTHTLGACLKTMFGFTDWRRLIVYLEFWISQGTTIFLFYIHTLSAEVDDILRIYEQDMNIEIHRIGWGELPSELPEDHPDNPNNNLWMGAQETQKNDCMLRFRSRVKYVVTLDTDELIALGYPTQTTFIQLLDQYFERGSVDDRTAVPGALMFLHTFASAKMVDTGHPTELAFREYRNIEMQNLIYNPWNRSKSIYKPDVLYDAGVHISRGFEEVTLANAIVPADEARLIHLRQLPAYIMATGIVEGIAETEPSTVLAAESKKWLRAWRKRIRGVRFNNGLQWNLNERQMMNATADCHHEGFAENWCPSVRRCMKRLDGFYSTWVRIGGAWITIKN